MNTMKLLPPACLAAALLCACAAPGPGPATPARPAGAAVVFERRTFKLSKTPDSDLEAALGDVLSAGYNAAVKRRSGDKPLETGFTYSMAPKGATYPFSEIEISCIMQEKYARAKGPGLCGDLFLELDQRLKRAVARSGR